MLGRLPPRAFLDDHADVNAVPLEQQYVRYAAATHSSLLDLLTHWQPWLPNLEWSHMVVHIPALADAIIVLVADGQVELLLGDRGSEPAPMSPADVPGIVTNPDSWWSPVDGTTPQTVLVLTAASGPASLPPRRPEATVTRP